MLFLVFLVNFLVSLSLPTLHNPLIECPFGNNLFSWSWNFFAKSVENRLKNKPNSIKNEVEESESDEKKRK